MKCKGQTFLVHIKYIDFPFFLQRRGAISYDSSDQTALYIRMLGKHSNFYFTTFCHIL